MREEKRQFNTNDKYLIDECKKHQIKDILTLSVKDKTFVVPYKYIQSAETPEEAKEKFKSALFDFQQKEKDKYHAAKDIPFTIDIEGMEYEYAKSKNLLNSCFGVFVTDLLNDDIIYNGEFERIRKTNDKY